MNIRAGQLSCLLLLLLAAAGPVTAGTITCVPGPGGGAGSSFNWVRRISIDEHSRTVLMDVVRSRTKDAETMGKMRAELVSMEDTQSGEPIYVFNSIPAPGVEAMNLFKLFKAGEWHLIGAGVTFVSKVPALRAVEQSAVFDCKRSGLG
ncbi:hypothetical protein [Variovorax sp. EL159]|uniref:hypothetical protein n=1 Tax=unclassified Variovorax TaxID=663243 RepID=UPI0008856393|nr:hypothetical protein [Variovorax sp. EL159]SCX46199.1 hypothetical protein SAMN03159363_0931 [Variovorax sp. EL159]